MADMRKPEKLNPKIQGWRKLWNSSIFDKYNDSPYIILYCQYLYMASIDAQRLSPLVWDHGINQQHVNDLLMRNLETANTQLLKTRQI